jgi:hypothetical protein
MLAWLMSHAHRMALRPNCALRGPQAQFIGKAIWLHSWQHNLNDLAQTRRKAQRAFGSVDCLKQFFVVEPQGVKFAAAGGDFSFDEHLLVQTHILTPNAAELGDRDEADCNDYGKNDWIHREVNGEWAPHHHQNDCHEPTRKLRSMF